MAERLTLISDPTNEFPENTNNDFKVRLPDGLRLEGKGWQVALLSLTLPNRDDQTGSFVFGTLNYVARVYYNVLHLTGPKDKPLDDYVLLKNSRNVIGPEVASATTGVAFWNKTMQLFNEDMVSNTNRLRKETIDQNRPTPTIYLKQSMVPSFYWDGEDLIIRRRTGCTDGNATTPKIYSSFDIAYEVALQWGFVKVDSNGKVVPGPNLQMNIFKDEITSWNPIRKTTLALTGVSTLNGKALHAVRNLDIPQLPRVKATGSNETDTVWYYQLTEDKFLEKWVRLSGYVEWRLTNLNATYDTIHKHKGKTVMVYTDLQQSTIVGATKAQLLRQLVVREGGQEGHTYSEPKHLEWVPVSTRQTDIIHVQLADVNGALMKLPTGKSLVTIALKQIV